MDAANSPATPQTDETPSPESGETSSPVASADRQATRSLDIDVTVCTDLVVRLRDHIHSAWDKVGSEERRLNDARSLRGMIAVGQTTGDYTVRQIPSGFNRFMSVKDRLDLLNEVNMFLVDRVLDRLRDRIGALKQSTATPALRSVANGIVDRMDTWKSLPDASKAAILTLLDTEQFWADVTEHAAATYDRQNGRGATATKKQQGNANKRARASAVSLADEPESSKAVKVRRRRKRSQEGASSVSDEVDANRPTPSGSHPITNPPAPKDAACIACPGLPAGGSVTRCDMVRWSAGQRAVSDMMRECSTSCMT
ncbi:Uncharacterized protein PBTT_07535 [Plasmodiophora brassicae]